MDYYYQFNFENLLLYYTNGLSTNKGKAQSIEKKRKIQIKLVTFCIG